MESSLREENTRLEKELQDAHLDLDDARRSRRDLQQQLSVAQQQMGQVNTNYDSLRVGGVYSILSANLLTHVEPQPLYYGID